MNIDPKNRRSLRGAAAALLLAAGGCSSSPPTRFYALSPVAQPGSAKPSSVRLSVVAVGPVTIPDYVNRPELVTVDGPNVVKIHDFERWAGPMDEELSRVLVEDLAAKLPPGRFDIMHWIPTINARVPLSHRLTVAVTRFEASTVPGGAAVLETDWAILGKNDTVLARRKSVKTSPLRGTDGKEIAAALSRCVADFSGDVAEALVALPEK